MARDILRRCVFRPYLKGKGPVFTLVMWATNRTDNRGQTVIGYTLCADAKPLFDGEDFSCSPMHADDSDASVATLMSFLTLRPGDTDSEYFESYTPAQMDFARAHGEALSLEVTCRFGEH